MNWTVSNRVDVVNNTWLRVTEDTCVRPDGSVIHPYYVIHGHDWVNIVPVTTDAELVLVREYRHGCAQTVLGLPGGLIDPGEALAADAAVRELSEEVGIHSLTELIPLGTVLVNPSTHTSTAHSFLAIVPPQRREQLFTIEPDISITCLPYRDVIHELLQPESVFSGYDIATLLRATFRLARPDMRRYPRLHHEISSIGIEFVGARPTHPERTYP